MWNQNSPSPNAPIGFPSTLMLVTSSTFSWSCWMPSARLRNGSGAFLRVPRSPKYDANRSWSSCDSFWPLNTSTRCSFQASLTALTSSLDSGLERSIPLISAPHAGDKGVTWMSMVSCMDAFSRGNGVGSHPTINSRAMTGPSREGPVLRARPADPPAGLHATLPCARTDRSPTDTHLRGVTISMIRQIVLVSAALLVFLAPEQAQAAIPLDGA